MFVYTLYRLGVDISVILMLGLASAQDILRREVDDWVWLLSVAPFALNLYALISGFAPLGPAAWGLEAGVLAGVGFLLYFLGLFGGADAKAMLTFALSTPWPVPPFRSQVGLFGLTVFENGVILEGVYAASVVILNASRAVAIGGYFGRYSGSPLGTKLWLALYAHRTTVGDYMRNYRKLILAERPYINKEGVVAFEPTHAVRLDSDEEAFVELSTLVKAGKIREDDEVWVSRGMPLVAFFFAGMLLTPAVGDLVYHLFAAIL